MFIPITNQGSPAVLSDENLPFVLEALAAYWQGDATSKLFLFTDNIVPSRQTKYADLTKPTFTGYADIDPITVLPDATFDSTGAEVSVTDAIHFRATADPLTPVTVYGWGMQLGTPTPTLFACGLLPIPFVFARANDGFSSLAIVHLANTQP